MCIFFTRKVDKNTTYPLLVHAVFERPIAGISPTTYWPNSLFLSIQVEETGKHTFQKLLHSSDVGSYLKFGGQVVMWGHNLPPLVEIGLTDLQKTWVGNCPPCPTIFYVPHSIYGPENKWPILDGMDLLLWFFCLINECSYSQIFNKKVTHVSCKISNFNFWYC